MVTSGTKSADKAVEPCYYLIVIELTNAVAEAVVSKIMLIGATLQKSAKTDCGILHCNLRLVQLRPLSRES